MANVRAKQFFRTFSQILIIPNTKNKTKVCKNTSGFPQSLLLKKIPCKLSNENTDQKINTTLVSHIVGGKNMSFYYI